MAYPASLDSFTTKTDGVDDVLAAHVNSLQTSVVAIETELGTDPAGSATDVKTRLAHSINNGGFLEFDGATELTIASGVITVTQNFHKIDTEADASSDYLDTINGGTDGLVVFARAVSNNRAVYIRHNVGNIYTAGSVTVILQTPGDLAILIYDSGLSKWLCGKVAAGGQLSGSGTAGYIPFYESADAFTSDAGLTFSTAAGLVINDAGGAAIDVRVETDNQTNLFFIDASADQAGFGATAGNEIATFDNAAGVVINETGAAAIDLRVEGDTATSLLFVDASADTVGIGTTTAGAIAQFSAGSGLVLNEGGAAAMDLRAESDTEANMVFLDASADLLYLGGSTNGVTVAKGGVTTIATPTAGALVIGNGAAGIDYNITINGETNDGVVAWMEDEDYFQFNDDVRPYERIIVPMGEISYFDLTGTSVAIATVSDGSTNMVVVNPTTALSAGAYEFDNGGSNNGRLRYTGAITKMFHVACTISIAPASANDVFVLGVAKGGTVIASSKILQKVAVAGDTQSTALHVMAELATNEYLELYVGNTTDADDLVIKTLNLFALGM